MKLNGFLLSTLYYWPLNHHFSLFIGSGFIIDYQNFKEFNFHLYHHFEGFVFNFISTLNSKVPLDFACSSSVPVVAFNFLWVDVQVQLKFIWSYLLFIAIFIAPFSIYLNFARISKYFNFIIQFIKYSFIFDFIIKKHYFKILQFEN
jgi:hypothetical protein